MIQYDFDILFAVDFDFHVPENELHLYQSLIIEQAFTSCLRVT